MPRDGALVKAYVMELANEPALACEFDANGRTILVTRRYPPGYDRCNARREERDFVCEN